MSSNDFEYQGVSRNAICPCGSGKRFKHCHGASSAQQSSTSPSAQKSPTTSSAAVIKPLEEKELFCTVEGKFYELDKQQGQYLFVSDHGDAKIQLDGNGVQILQAMEVFSTYEQHFSNCSKKLGVNQEQFKNAVNSLYQQDFFRSAQSVIQGFSQPSLGEELTELAGICIRTCDSPKYLKRILESQIRRKNEFAVNENVYIFDDSKNPQLVNENKEIVKNASDEINVFYHGLEWQKNFVQNIVNIFPNDAKIIESLLLPQRNTKFSGGRIMNLALLFFAGRRYLNFDDDFILDDVRTHKIASNTIQVGTSSDRIFDGYDNEEHVKQSGIPLDFDPLSLHKQALGLSLSEFLLNPSDGLFKEISLDGLNCYYLERYKNDSFIVTSGNGWFGTSGKRNGGFIFYQSYKKIKPPWETAANFDQLLSGGYCWDSIDQTEIVGQAYSTPTGINNTRLLAPTVAVCKSEDTLLCTMANIIHPSSVHLGFPWALAHFRQTKNWENDTFVIQKPFLLPDLISDISSCVSMPDSASSYDRLKYISNALYEVSQLSEKLFIEKLQTTYITNSMFKVRKLFEQLELLGEDYNKVKIVIKDLIRNDLDHLYTDKLPPIEDAVGISEGEQLKWAQKELCAYAKGLNIWPKLWDHCASLNIK